MRALLALCLVLSLALPARADEPASDPERDKIIGIVTADVGVALLLGGIGMLIGAVYSDEVPTKNGLNLAGGISTAVGGVGVLVGTVIWFLARKQISDKKAGKVTLRSGGIGFTF